MTLPPSTVAPSTAFSGCDAEPTSAFPSTTTANPSVPALSTTLSGYVAEPSTRFSFWTRICATASALVELCPSP